MTYVRPRHWAWIVLPYAAGAALIGLSVPWLKTCAGAHFGKPGFAVAFVINLAMPGLVVLLSALYPKLSTALGGALAATIVFLVVVGLPVPPPSLGWLGGVVGAMGPVLFVACIMYHVLAVGTVLILRPIRRAGVPPDPMCCAHCGYSRVGLTVNRCPECFSPLPPC